jgi:hypothetical protein
MKGVVMFKIIMNGNIVEETRGFGIALRKAKKIKELFCKAGEVIIEDSRGYVIQRLGGKNVYES